MKNASEAKYLGFYNHKFNTPQGAQLSKLVYEIQCNATINYEWFERQFSQLTDNDLLLLNNINQYLLNDAYSRMCEIYSSSDREPQLRKHLNMHSWFYEMQRKFSIILNRVITQRQQHTTTSLTQALASSLKREISVQV